MNASVACPKCRISLEVQNHPMGRFSACQNCGQEIQIEAFPALLRPVTAGQTGERVMMEGEASCFYHPNKKASVPCGACGRFLCALCDIDLNGDHYCPSCVESGRRKGKLASLENQRLLYDELALLLAVLGILACGLTAPVALYYAIRYWKHPISLTSRFRWRGMMAIILSVLVMAGWGAILVFAIKA
jgi:hypothetical protein